MSEEELPKSLPSPEAMRRVAAQLRGITVRQSMQPLENGIAARVRTVLADCVEELARLREEPALARERRLEARADNLAILATTRRLPLEAVEALLRSADREGRASIAVGDLRIALQRTEADFG